MPTLLSINNYFYARGGAEVVFLEHGRLLEEAGWKVVPFAMQHPDNLETNYSQFFVEDIELGVAYPFWGKVSRALKSVYSMEARHKLDRLLAASQPDICHAHNIYHHLSPSILSLIRRRGVKVVLTLHDLKLVCPAYKMLSHDGICERCRKTRLFNVLLHRCVKGSISLSALVMVEAVLHHLLQSYDKNVDRFIVPSRFYLEKMIDWGWGRDRFVYLPNFVRTDALHADFAAGQSFLYFGRLSAEKGVATLIRAAASAKVPLRIVGTGPEEGALRRLALDCKVDVEFTGYLTGTALYDAVRSARAVVLPSEWYENAPLSIMEAYALGKPVIGSLIGGIPELIQEGETGETFTYGSADALASALRDFANLPNGIVSEMGRSARAWMERDFTPERYRERMLELYRELGVAC